MPSAYLDVAERVLAGATGPLSAGEILLEARRRGLLPKRLHGLRQDRTLQARLSEDISRYGPKSRFFRSGPGKYFLRSLKSAGGGDIGEYFARPRRNELRRADVLALKIDFGSMLRRDGASISFSKIVDSLVSGSYS